MQYYHNKLVWGNNMVVNIFEFIIESGFKAQNCVGQHVLTMIFWKTVIDRIEIFTVPYSIRLVLQEILVWNENYGCEYFCFYHQSFCFLCILTRKSFVVILYLTRRRDFLSVKILN